MIAKFQEEQLTMEGVIGAEGPFKEWNAFFKDFYERLAKERKKNGVQTQVF